MQFTPAADNQPSVEVKLLMGESPLASGNLELGTFHLTGLPLVEESRTGIVVEFSVTSTCAVSVKAQVANSKISSEKLFDAPSYLTDDFIAEKLAEAAARSKTDRVTVEKYETISAARALVNEAEHQLSKASDSKLSQAVATLGLAIESQDVNQVRAEAAALRRLLRTPVPFDFSSIFDDAFAGNLFGNRGSLRPQDRQQKAGATSTLRQSAPTREQPLTNSGVAATTKISQLEVGQRA